MSSGAAPSKGEFRILIVYPNLAMMLVPSIAVGLFTRIFKREGYQVDLFDTTHYVSDENSSPQNRVRFLQAREFNETKDLGVRIKTDLLGDFKRKVADFQPDLMVFSVVEDAWRQALSLLGAVEDLGIPHILGGVFPTAAPEVCISHPAVRMIGLGEGEGIVVAVAEALRLRRPLEDIPGAWYKDPSGAIHRNPKPPLVDINDSRPDFSLFDEARFYRPMGGRVFKTIPVETYRGCPFQCTYCNSPMQVSLARKDGQGGFLRRKAMASLRDELLELRQVYQPEFVYFVDDSFLARPQREIFEFCDMYEEFKVPFWMNTRPETCTPEILRRLKEVGVYRFSIGIECGNEQYRRHVLRRQGANEDIHGYFKVVVESGIAFSVNLMIGFPGETRDLVMDTVRFVRSIEGFDTLTVSIFTPYHGTVLRDVAVRNGWLDPGHVARHTTSSSQLSMPAPFLSSQEIDGLVRVIPLYAYFPLSEWDTLRRAEIPDDEGNRILKRYGDIYKEKFLRQTQEDRKAVWVEGSGGCRSDPKDSFRFPLGTPDRMTLEEMRLLMHSD